MKRYWSQYSSKEFAALDRGRLIAVLPVGATEQHGPHLPLAVDTRIADGVVSRVAEKLPEDSPVLFLPTQAIGRSVEHARYPGTLTVSAETLIRTWTEIGNSVAAAGVRKFVLLNSHGGQISIMDIVARDLRIRHAMLAFSVNWFGFGMPEGVYDDHEMRHGIHAGDMETSVMLALSPELVAMSEARDFQSATTALARDYDHISLAGPARPAWQTQDLQPQGACGNAAAATAAKGEATLEHACDRIVGLMGEIDRLPLAFLANSPAW